MTHEIEEGVMATAAMKAQAKCIDDGVQFASISFDLGFTAGYQAALPKWRDISTAPKDGALILGINAASPDEVAVVKWRDDLKIWQVMGDGIAAIESMGDLWCDYLSNWCTHWQPLPSPPKDNES